MCVSRCVSVMPIDKTGACDGCERTSARRPSCSPRCTRSSRLSLIHVSSRVSHSLKDAWWPHDGEKTRHAPDWRPKMPCRFGPTVRKRDKAVVSSTSMPNALVLSSRRTLVAALFERQWGRRQCSVPCIEHIGRDSRPSRRCGTARSCTMHKFTSTLSRERARGDEPKKGSATFDR